MCVSVAELRSTASQLNICVYFSRRASKDSMSIEVLTKEGNSKKYGKFTASRAVQLYTHISVCDNNYLPHFYRSSKIFIY